MSLSETSDQPVKEKTKEIVRQAVEDILAGPDGPRERIEPPPGESLEEASQKFYQYAAEQKASYWYQRWFPSIFGTSENSSTKYEEENNKKTTAEIQKEIDDTKEAMQQNGMYDAILTRDNLTVEEWAKKTEELREASEQFKKAVDEQKPWFQKTM